MTAGYGDPMEKLTAERERIIEELASEKPRLMNYIRRRARNVSETEDIYQEAMARLARQLQTGELPANPAGYLYRIATNIINDGMRRRQEPMESVDELADSLSCEQPQPDQQLNDQQCLALFVKQLNELPTTTRNIIIMRKLDGKTNVEIARHLGLSAKAVEKQLNRALKAIESKMARYLEPRA